MPPTPKHASTRARRNKTSTNAVLSADHAIVAPELPERDWHPMTLAWWRDVWASPMAPEFDDSDRHGLFMLAALIDQFWTEPAASLAAEIRLQRQCFGLTPIDRRRLQWEIERSEEAQEKGTKRRSRAQPGGGKDPRGTLRLA